MTPLPVIEHANAEALAAAVADALACAIRDGVAARGDAWLALAGGSTPFAAYRKLAAMALPWSQVHLLASDERWVPAGHERRNERALAEAFAAANGVRIHPLVPVDADGAGFEERATTTDRVDPRLRTSKASLAPLGHRAFDAVLLGMGTDAHFASLFPRVTPLTALDAGSREAVVAITPDPLPPDAPFPRISLTLPRLASAKCLMLMLTGDAKRRVLEEARTLDANLAPINALLSAAPDLAIHWSP